MNSIRSRRAFVRTAATIAAATTLPRWFLEESEVRAQEPAKSPNDKPGIALIGCGGRGKGVARDAATHGQIVAYCDVDEARLAEAKQIWPDAAPLADFRKVLERKDVDVIVNATPDHWHTLVSIAALKAGKDVYSEKPLTLTIAEGQRLVQVVQSTNRILQTGSQQRSDKNFRLACELVRNGRLGKLQHVNVWLPCGRREGPFIAEAVPSGLNWDMWLGQTPQVEYVKERCHQSFRYWWEYSGGTMTDWGAHHLDIALWGTGFERSGPVSVAGKPLVEMIPGGFTAASEYEVQYTYANGVTQTCQSTPANAWNGRVIDPSGQQHGVKFTGDGGWIFVTRGKIEASDPELLTTPLPASATRLSMSDNHMRNFIDSVRSRQQPICDAEIGHRSVSVCHLGVIAMRLGRKLEWDPTKEQFAGDAEANRWLSREMRKPWTLDAVERMHVREPFEFVAIFAGALGFLWAAESLGSGAQVPLAFGVAAWAGVKTLYYLAETLRHLAEATSTDLAYHRFLVLMAYNMAQITLSYALDFYCLYRIDPTSLNGIDPELRGFALFFECFYFSVLNFSFFGYGDIIPAHVPGKIVMLLEVVTAFSTVIFLLSDFVSMKESMRRKP